MASTTSGWQPLSLNSKQHLVAALRAIGHTHNEISAATGISIGSIAVLCTSDLFKAEVARIQEQIKNHMVQDAVSMLMAQTKRSVETIVEVRDNPNNSPTVRLKASDSILNKVPQTANATRVQQLPPSEIKFSDDQISFLISALNEDPKAKEAFESASRRSMIEMTEVDDPPRPLADLGLEDQGFLAEYQIEGN